MEEWHTRINDVLAFDGIVMIGTDLQLQLTNGLKRFRLDLTEAKRTRSRHLNALKHGPGRTSNVAFPFCNGRIVIFIDVEVS
jgi:hypothetical protein